jgi:hypothetical protein
MKETIKDCFVCFLLGAKTITPMAIGIAVTILGLLYFPATTLVISGVVAFVAFCVGIGEGLR